MGAGAGLGAKEHRAPGHRLRWDRRRRRASGSLARSVATHFAGSRTSTLVSCTAPVTSSAGRASTGGGLSTGEYDTMTARSSGSAGFPHSSHSGIVRGSDGSDMVATTSTNGTSAIDPGEAFGTPGVQHALQQATRRQPAAHDAECRRRARRRDSRRRPPGRRRCWASPADDRRATSAGPSRRRRGAGRTRTPPRGRAATAVSATSRSRSRGPCTPRRTRSRTDRAVACRRGRHRVGAR